MATKELDERVVAFGTGGDISTPPLRRDNANGSAWEGIHSTGVDGSRHATILEARNTFKIDSNMAAFTRFRPGHPSFKR